VRRLAEDPVDTAERRAEQRGPRYAVIVQADELLGLSTAIVAPTSRSAAPATFRPEVVVAGDATRVLVEQLRTVDLDRLDRHVGRLTPEEQRAVDPVLELSSRCSPAPHEAQGLSTHGGVPR
jgi:mRNA interferase MazF